MYSTKRKDSGWVLCPSKSFPGKFYYFNVATGETAWCSNETERKSSAIQRVDHGYPEPSSPPTDNTPTISINQQRDKVNPYHERNLPQYPQEFSNPQAISIYQNPQRNLDTYSMSPFDLMPQSMPYQILPMTWPGMNIPQVFMVVMNQAMRQLSIEDPRVAFKQPVHAIEPNWHGPGQSWNPNQTWKGPNQPLRERYEPYQPWKDPKKYSRQPNQYWNEPSQLFRRPNQSRTEPNELCKDPNQSSTDSNEPERELFIQTGKAPLSDRFRKYNKPPEPNEKISQAHQHESDDQNEMSKNMKFKPIFGQNQSSHPTPSISSQSQQDTFFRKPILNFAKEKTPKLNPFAKTYENKSKSDVLMPSMTHSVSSPKSQSSIRSQSILKPNQLQFLGLTEQNQINNNKNNGPSQTNKEIFGQRQTKQRPFEQSQTKQGLLEQNRTKQGPFEQSQTKQGVFEQSQAKQGLYEKCQTKQGLFEESQTKQRRFGQSQMKQELFGPNQKQQGLFKEIQTKPRFFMQIQPRSEMYPSQTQMNKESTFKRSDKIESPKRNIQLPPCSELNDSNVNGKSPIKLDNKTAIPQDMNLPDLDKNDLRRYLMEKKRKSTVSETIKTKKIKTFKEPITMETPKKKVTFNLIPDNFSDSGNDDSTYKDTECRKVLPPSQSEPCYVVTDLTTLLEDFDVLNRFVKSDPNCTLIVPSGVTSELNVISRGESLEADLVSRARHLVRALATPQPQINVRNSEDISMNISTSDSILNCCLEVLNKAHVVLITNDENLQTKAEYLDIDWMTSDQIRNSEANEQKIHFDIKKINSNTDNDENITIPLKEFENLSFGTENSSTQMTRKKCIRNKDSYIRESDKAEYNPGTNGVDFENLIQTFETQKYPKNTTTFDSRESRNSMIKNKTENDKNQQNKSETFFTRRSMENIFFPETDTEENPATMENEIETSCQKKENIIRFLKGFYVKYKKYENVIEERKNEFECHFRQIMEECFNEILQNKSINTEPVLKSIPLTLIEALECMVKVYANHTYLSDIVAIITAILNAKAPSGKYLICAIGCGVAIVQYLKIISPTSDVLKNTEEALNMMLGNLTQDIEYIGPRPPIDSADRCDVKKCNFVKDRAEVVNYLKKHFATWADYDETFEETSNVFWGKNFKDNTVVRTYGKNLSMLKLANSKAMTMENDSFQNICQNTIKNDLDHVDQNGKLGNKQNTKINSKDVYNINSNENIHCAMDLKLTRTIKNTTAKQNNVDRNNKIDEVNSKNELSEPKIIRIFSNIDFTKNHTNKEKEKQVFDDWSTHGHTFGTTERNGPKIIKNIKPIKEFEEKLKTQQNFDLGDKSEDSDNINNCLFTAEGNDNKKSYWDAHKSYVDVKNDDLKNNRCETNDQNLESNHNSTATNNEIHSMSLEHCITNNTYGTFDLDAILSDPKPSDHYNSIFDIDMDSDVIDGFKNKNNISFESDNVLHDMKDDSINDSEYTNFSLQAYHLMDTFLMELKTAFKAMHMFIENCVREFRAGAGVSAAVTRTIRHQAETTRAHLTKIIENLNGIVKRENTSGPKLKELVAGAGSIAGNDERIDQYRETVIKCYNHAHLIDKALIGVVTLTNENIKNNCL